MFSHFFTQIIKKTFSLLAVVFLFVLASIPAQAGGGPIEINVTNNYGQVGDKIPVQATIYTDNHDNVETGRKAEFRIKNQRAGDLCVTSSNISDGNGRIYGDCYVATAGKIEVYVYWFDRDLTSSSVFIDFVAAKNPQPIAPSTKPKASAPTVVKATTSPVASPPTSPSATASESTLTTPNPSPTPSPRGFTAFLKSPLNFLRQLFASLFNRSKPVNPQASPSLAPTITDTQAPVLKKALFDTDKPVFRTADLCLEPKFEDDSQQIKLRFKLNKQNWSEWQTESRYCLEKLADGTYQVDIEAKDGADNTASASGAFIIQTQIPVSLSGTLYHDQNCNYQRDPGEPGINGLQVQILESTETTSQFLSPATSDAQGQYSFKTKIAPGKQLVLLPNVFGTEYVLVTMSGYPKRVVLSQAQPASTQNIPLVRVGETSQCQ